MDIAIAIFGCILYLFSGIFTLAAHLDDIEDNIFHTCIYSSINMISIFIICYGFNSPPIILFCILLGISSVSLILQIINYIWLDSNGFSPEVITYFVLLLASLLFLCLVIFGYWTLDFSTKTVYDFIFIIMIFTVSVFSILVSVHLEAFHAPIKVPVLIKSSYNSKRYLERQNSRLEKEIHWLREELYKRKSFFEMDIQLEQFMRDLYRIAIIDKCSMIYLENYLDQYESILNRIDISPQALLHRVAEQREEALGFTISINEFYRHTIGWYYPHDHESMRSHQLDRIEYGIQKAFSQNHNNNDFYKISRDISLIQLMLKKLIRLTKKTHISNTSEE